MTSSAFAACRGDGRTPVVLYSPHGRDQLSLLEQAFERRRPDIDVRWLDMGSQEILDRLRFERVNPQADVWFGGPTTIFDRGIRDSLLTPYRPSWAEQVGPNGIGPDDLYYPVYRTPAVIAFNSKLVPRAEAPRDWDEVLQRRWTDKVLIRDPMASGTMRAIWGLILFRSLRQTGDTARAMQWLRRLDGQTKTYTLNPAILVRQARARRGTGEPLGPAGHPDRQGQGHAVGLRLPARAAPWSSTMRSVWSGAASIPRRPRHSSTTSAAWRRSSWPHARSSGFPPATTCLPTVCRRG